MFNVKCIKCGWTGQSIECSPQWMKLDEETSKLLLICPQCKDGVVKEVKPPKKSKGKEVIDESSGN